MPPSLDLAGLAERFLPLSERGRHVSVALLPELIGDTARVKSTCEATGDPIQFLVGPDRIAGRSTPTSPFRW